MRVIADDIVDAALSYDRLIPAIKNAFSEDWTVPMRSHLEVENPLAGVSSTLLMMPLSL